MNFPLPDEEETLILDDVSVDRANGVVLPADETELVKNYSKQSVPLSTSKV